MLSRPTRHTATIICGAKSYVNASRYNLAAERLKLVQAHYADAIPLNLLRNE